MRGVLLAAAMAGAATPACAQTGATVGVPLRSGTWGAGGWQADAASPPAPASAAPAPQEAPPAATYMPTNVAPADSAPGYPPLRGDYRPIRPGKRLPDAYADPVYTVVDWPSYGLERPYPGTRWIRYFDDAVLADPRGRAVYVRYRVAWNAPRRAARASGYAAPGYTPPGYTPPVASTTTVRTGPDTTVTTQVIPPARGYYGGGYGPDYGWGPGVTVTPSIVTTTTTTSYEPAPRGGRH